MMKIGKSEYKLIHLDTNALREIVTNEGNSMKGYFNKFMDKNELYAPCFSFYNVIELMPYEDIYQKFLDFFSLIPCLMFYPTRIIIQEEYKTYLNKSKFEFSNKIINAFTPITNNDSYNCRKFFERVSTNVQLIRVIQDEISELKNTANIWEAHRESSKQLLIDSGYQMNIKSEEFYRFSEKDTIYRDLLKYGLNPAKEINLDSFPTLRIMEYSQYNRVYLTSKKIKPNDVMDIVICGIVPYLDAVVTENFQANVYKKAKNFIPQMKLLEIYTLKDLRISLN